MVLILDQVFTIDSPSPFPLDFGFRIWDLDFGTGFGTWIPDLDLGLDLGLTIIITSIWASIIRSSVFLVISGPQICLINVTMI